MDAVIAPGRLLVRHPIAGCAVSAALVALALAAAVDHSHLLLVALDQPIEHRVQAHRSATGNTVARAATFFGSYAATYPGGAVLAALAALRSRPTAVFVVACTALRPLVEAVLKAVIDRARPDVDPTAISHGASFPSGHVLGSTVLVVSALSVAGLYVRPPVLRRVLDGLGVVLLLAVGASRVYLGYHWATDVVGGWLAGALLVALVDLACRRRPGWWATGPGRCRAPGGRRRPDPHPAARRRRRPTTARSGSR